MKRKINVRLVGISILAILMTMIGITMIDYSLFKNQVKKDLSVTANLLKDSQYFELKKQEKDIDFSTTGKDLRITWIAKDGQVLYDNDTSAWKLQNHRDRPEVKAAFKNGMGECIRKSDTMNSNTFYYAILLENGTVLRVATQAQNIWYTMGSALPMVGCILLFVFVLCVILSQMLTRQLIAPIERMAENISDTSIHAPYKEFIPFVQMIRQQHAQILASAKMRQDFTANVSHELKTPLTAISGYAELLENGMVEEERKPHFYQEIRKNAERLFSLINDIIRLSELDRSKEEPDFMEMDLYECVRDCMEALRMSAQKRKIELEFVGESCQIRGNQDMIRELTENLVQNAIKYNVTGGKVRVEVKKKERPVLFVTDTGIGIPLEDQKRIFERFYRVDKSRSRSIGGTGLGLAIVKHIVELHHAKIDLDSMVGVGTSIQIIF